MIFFFSILKHYDINYSRKKKSKNDNLLYYFYFSYYLKATIAGCDTNPSKFSLILSPFVQLNILTEQSREHETNKGPKIAEKNKKCELVFFIILSFFDYIYDTKKPFFNDIFEDNYSFQI